MSKIAIWMASTVGLLMFSSVSSVARSAEFILEKGKGVDVCDAYVKRLNQTDFTHQYGPICGRPEDTSVPGFAKLGRVKLSYDDLYAVGDLLLGFYSNNDQDYLQKLGVEKLAVCDQPGREKYCQHILTQKREEESQGLRWNSQLDPGAMRDGKEFAWRYEPPVDIDNDSKPDALLLFRRRCDSVQLGGTYAYVMEDDSYRRIDEARTRAIFGHPNQKWPEGMSNHKAFRYIGLSNGVFSYRDQFYFDTFYWIGDLHGERRSDPAIPNTLGVFHHQGGRTDLVCEIRWNPPSNFFVK